MKTRDCTLALAVTTVALTGCFETQRDETFEDTVTLDDVEVRILHAVEDAPTVNVLVDDERKVSDLGFLQAPTESIEAGTRRLSLEGLIGLDSVELLLESVELEFEEGRRYDILIGGRLDEDSVEVVVLGLDDEPFPPEDDDEDADEDARDPVRVRAVHMAGGVDAVDVFLTEYGASLDEPVGTLSFTEGSGAIELEPGLFRIRLTEPGNTENILYDSGDDTLVNLAEGHDLLFAVVGNTGVDADSPVSVVRVDGSKVDEYFHKEQRGGFQYVHNARGLGPVDISAQGGKGADDLEYTQVQPGAGIGDYDFSIRSARDVIVTKDNDDELKRNLKINRGRSRTVMLLGDVQNGGEEEILSFRNEDRRVSTNARLRVVHGAEAMGDVDVYLLPGGTDIAEEGVLTDPILSGFGFRKGSAYLPIPEGNYEFVVTEAGAPSNTAIEQSLELDAGGIYRIITSDSDDESNRLLLGDNPLPE